MYINQLIDSYKTTKSYVQDKQIAHDLGISVKKLSDIRKGRRYLTENEALYLAGEVGADKEMVLVYLAADKAKSYEAQTLWKALQKSLMGVVYKEYQWLAVDWLCGLAALTKLWHSTYYVYYVK